MRYVLLANHYLDFYLNRAPLKSRELLMLISTKKEYVERYGAVNGLSYKIFRELARLKPELILVIAYGEKISPQALESFPARWCNLHFSSLPRFRGATPIESTMLTNTKLSGVSIIQMSEKIDTGKLLLKREITLREKESFETVEEKLLQASLPLFHKLFNNSSFYLERAKEQSGIASKALSKRALEARRVLREDLSINEVLGAVQSLSKRGVYLPLDKERKLKLRLFSLEELCLQHELPFKTELKSYIALYKRNVYCSFSDGAVSIGDLQMQGKKRMKAYEWFIGYRIRGDERRTFCRFS
jgi:methionyl-tRNA formyltransferase